MNSGESSETEGRPSLLSPITVCDTVHALHSRHKSLKWPKNLYGSQRFKMRSKSLKCGSHAAPSPSLEAPALGDISLRAYFHYGCALRCVASDSQR